MKKIAFVLIMIANVGFAKDNQQVVLGDSIFNNSFTNNYDIKSSAIDGNWIVFYDMDKTDTALTCVIQDGKYHGLVKKWDKSSRVVSEIFYLNGEKHGLSKEYMYGDGQKYENVQEFDKGKLNNILKMEW